MGVLFFFREADTIYGIPQLNGYNLGPKKVFLLRMVEDGEAAIGEMVGLCGRYPRLRSEAGNDINDKDEVNPL